MSRQILNADCIDAMRGMPEASVDAIVTDPPYGLEFMGKEWDRLAGTPGYNERGRITDRPDAQVPYGRGGGVNSYQAGRPMQEWHQAWAREALRILKPGGHLLAFGGTRTYHRLACAVEDAGFEIRDSLIWLYGQGFPKSLNVGCRCEDGGRHADGESEAERELPRLRGEDVSEAVPATGGEGALLLAGVPEPRSSTERAVSAARGAGEPQRIVEGRGDDLAEGGQLPADQVRPGARVGEADGPEGRLSDGASPSHGADGREASDANGGRPPSGPRPDEQRARESRALADEPGSQAGGGWPLCPRCGLPSAGLGTALKPGHEPIVVARKPLIGTVAANVLEHGTGALNIDGCRIEGVAEAPGSTPPSSVNGQRGSMAGPMDRVEYDPTRGRWPANVVLDEEAAAELDRQSGDCPAGVAVQRNGGGGAIFGGKRGEAMRNDDWGYGDTGGASRFFYCAKASRAERNAGLDGFEAKRSGVMQDDSYKWERDGKGNEISLDTRSRNHHPTVKPIDLMRWLVRLVTPPGGTVLDPFTGSGTTGAAAVLEGCDFVGIEREAEYAAIAEARIEWWAQHQGREAEEVLAISRASETQLEAMGQMGLDVDVDVIAKPVKGDRAGEASAERRYAGRGASDFAMKPGRRRAA